MIYMKHFLLEGEHLVPFEELAPLVPKHHEFLQRGYDGGVFLFSGPQVPAHGGFLVARAESPEALSALLAEEPFVAAGKMQFSRTIRFDPVQHQPFLKDWFAGAPAAQIAAPASAGAPPVAAEAPNGMRHFLLEGEHLVPFEERAPALIVAHRAFLQKGYDRGDLLFSGPTIPPKGGVLVARAPSLSRLRDMLGEEPYAAAGVMRFKRTTEFDPVERQALLEPWFLGASGL
jgi:uncharacterized protein YciI